MSVPAGAVAIVVGIDSYPNHPLTSAENDARAFRGALIKHDLVDAKNIQLITGPDATKAGILDAIEPYYMKGEGVPRFIFFFAGHGCLGYVDAARSRAHTTLAPVEFDHFGHADRLIDLDDIVERMLVAGPQEQFFFVDACRDIPYDAVPNLSAIPWGAAKPGVARAQAVLYAVKPFGQATGVRSGMGVMTTHIVSALDGTGRALEFDPDLNDYVITANSVKAYAAEMVLRAVSGEEQWREKYRIPELRLAGDATKPIRTVPNVQPVRLTVHIEPNAAAPQTEVILSQGRVVVQRWLPNANHEPVDVQPQRHFLEATSTAGSVDPVSITIDAREQREATVRVSAGPPARPKGPQLSGLGGTTLVTAVQGRGDGTRTVPGESRTATITAVAKEPQVAIAVEGLQPPYVKKAGRQKLTAQLPPGPYGVSFRLGTNVFSQTEVQVREGESITVRPTVAGSALLREALGERAQQEDAVISESIGPIQAGVVPTMLPIIGLKMFDVRHELFGQFAGVVPTLDPKQFGAAPLALVVAIDGDGWHTPPDEMLRGIRLNIDVDAGPTEPPIVRPLVGPGFDRILIAAAPAPRSSFFVRISSPHLGRVLVATAAIRGRATVLTARFTPEGRLEISQNLLRLPGVVYDEPDPGVAPGRMIRQLQLGQELYQSGELANPEFTDHDLDLISGLFYAKWTDPILSCMAFFALSDAATVSRSLGGMVAAKSMYAEMVPEVTKNLMRFFPDLPDSRIVHALGSGDTSRLDAMLERRDVPVLTRSALALATYDAQRKHPASENRESLADQITRGPKSISQFVRSIPVDSAWSILREVPSSRDVGTAEIQFLAAEETVAIVEAEGTVDRPEGRPLEEA
jgi:hypothetical protein